VPADQQGQGGRVGEPDPGRHEGDLAPAKGTGSLLRPQGCCAPPCGPPLTPETTAPLEQRGPRPGGGVYLPAHIRPGQNRNCTPRHGRAAKFGHQHPAPGRPHEHRRPPIAITLATRSERSSCFRLHECDFAGSLTTAGPGIVLVSMAAAIALGATHEPHRPPRVCPAP
jgi:hypothetical protein